MNKKLLLFSTVLLTLCSCNGGGGTSSYTPAFVADDSEFLTYDDINASYTNVIRPGGGDAPDPFIMRFNGKYYLYMTTASGRIRGYVSDNLYEWYKANNGVCSEGYVYETSCDEGISPVTGITSYAPEVKYYNGKFYLIASSPAQQHNVFEATSPEGPFNTIARNIDSGVIDGHLFISSNEDLYLYTSGTSGINARKMELDFTSFSSETATSLFDLNTGGWTEGPYLLQRYGKGYLTYCGSHYLSDNYRVDYAYVDEDVTNYLQNSSYQRQGTVVLSTENNYTGLGHSSTVLGPDLDSHYIVYHNLSSAGRPFNLARLQFNGSKMIADGVHAGEHNGVTVDYEVELGTELAVTDNLHLSDIATEEDFTAEFNTIGEGKMIFSYVDNNNYSYLNFANNSIEIADVVNGNKKTVETIELIQEYDTEVIHTFRFQHKDGKYALYFDDIEKVYDGNYKFKAGKIGYDDSFADMLYTAFSNVAMGSSDKKYHAEDASLANGYDEYLSVLNKGSGLVNSGKDVGTFVQEEADYMVLDNKDDRATYRLYARNDGKYHITMRASSDSVGKKVGVRIDNGEIIECVINSETGAKAKGDIYLSLTDVDITAGQHYVSIYNLGDKVKFSEIRYEKEVNGSSFVEEFKTTEFKNKFNVLGSFTESEDGLKTESAIRTMLVTKEKYRNPTISIDYNINTFNGGNFSLLFNVNNFSNNITSSDAQLNSLDLFQGYRVYLKSSAIIVSYVDYNSSIVTVKNFNNLSLPAKTNHNVTLKLNNNKLTVFADDNEVGSVYLNIGSLHGGVGICSNNADAVVSSLSVEC